MAAAEAASGADLLSLVSRSMLENMDVFSFELDEADMATLDGKTTDEAIAKFKELYTKCVVRDTPDAARLDLAKTDITPD